MHLRGVGSYALLQSIPPDAYLFGAKRLAQAETDLKRGIADGVTWTWSCIPPAEVRTYYFVYGIEHLDVVIIVHVGQTLSLIHI